MNRMLTNSSARMLAAVAGVWIGVAATSVPAAPPSLSANPGMHAIFPARGQSPDQQRLDESASYDWATQQTRWDPYQARTQLEQQMQAAGQTASGARGGALKGAAGGALVGVAVGAIAGDAGKGAAIGSTAAGLTGGMRSRRTMKAAESTSDAAVAAYQQQFSFWDRNFMAAMEAKGYTVR